MTAPRFVLFHSADWHLGQTLHGIDRGIEHERFFQWLVETLEQAQANALVVAGDVFDSASPSAAAQQRYYRFLAELRGRLPHLQVVILGGNHDSPARLDAPSELLQSLGVQVVGGLRPGPGGLADPTRHILRLKGPENHPGIDVVALPFLRPRDVPMCNEGALESDPAPRFVAGYAGLLAHLMGFVRSEGPTVATGHCFLAGTASSPDSERKIQMGNQAALPAELYLRHKLAYVALGHLHRAQAVQAPHVRYSGSPIPLSMAERTYIHQVLQVDLAASGPARVRSHPVPRTVPFERVPAEPAALEAVEQALRALPRLAQPPPEDEWPILEVPVLLGRPEPKLRERIQAALHGASVRLARISVRQADVPGPAATAPARLEELSEEEVFVRAYRRARGVPPPPAVREVFAELQAAVDGQETL